MVHFGPLADGVRLEDVLSILEPGDVMTHIYRPANGTTIFDEDGKVAECVRQARARGVILESGCARSHLSFESVRKAFADNFPPDIISTDMVGYTFYWKPSGWLMLKMSIYLNAGMSLADIVRAVTYIARQACTASWTRRGPWSPASPPTLPSPGGGPPLSS